MIILLMAILLKKDSPDQAIVLGSIEMTLEVTMLMMLRYAIAA